ncbi:MAG: hypothetical protein EB054_04985 [Actinobacteria bacterium]|jgi:hypothetical protein|nr:hypothetical protein [Actinomycetota bacterium]
MAKIVLDGGELKLQLSKLEVLGALHQSPRAPIGDVVRVRRVSDPWNRETMRGVRAPGTGIPYVIMLGTLRHRGEKSFSAVYRRRPAVVIEFGRGEFGTWIVTTDTELPNNLLEQLVD